MMWVTQYADRLVYVEADRYFDAREAVRQAVGSPTYDDLVVVRADCQDSRADYVVRYEGNASSGTLRRVIESTK
jgi:hypothetical protein